MVLPNGQQVIIPHIHPVKILITEVVRELRVSYKMIVNDRPEQVVHDHQPVQKLTERLLDPPQILVHIRRQARVPFSLPTPKHPPIASPLSSSRLKMLIGLWKSLSMNLSRKGFRTRKLSTKGTIWWSAGLLPKATMYRQSKWSRESSGRAR